MGGSDPYFEEAKTSNDHIERTYQMFITHPVYSCAAVGIFIFIALAYVFLQR